MIVVLRIRCLVCLVVLACLAAGTSAVAAETASRHFRLDYGASLVDLPAGSRVRVWVPVPSSDRYQTIRRLQPDLPAAAQFHREPKYGNQLLYFEVTASAAGVVSFATPYLVQRREVRMPVGEGNGSGLTERERRLFLSANAKVPLTGKQLTLLSGVDFGDSELDLARALYNRVDEHVRYDKSQPGFGQGDVQWVCDSGFGNCTDFHSLFISWARAKGLPARFEIGFPLPPERGTGGIKGYHCWAAFHTAAQGWAPVDISEADKHPEMKDYYFGNLTADRVAFTTGRDITLVPQQDGPPLNYFVYPHVEVNGRQWPQEKIRLQLGYRDVEPARE